MAKLGHCRCVFFFWHTDYVIQSHLALYEDLPLNYEIFVYFLSAKIETDIILKYSRVPPRLSTFVCAAKPECLE